MHFTFIYFFFIRKILKFKYKKKICLAPGTYSPEKVNLDKSPEYSFGIRVENHKTESIPGKNPTEIPYLNKCMGS